MRSWIAHDACELDDCDICRESLGYLKEVVGASTLHLDFCVRVPLCVQAENPDEDITDIYWGWWDGDILTVIAYGGGLDWAPLEEEEMNKLLVQYGFEDFEWASNALTVSR